MQRLPQALRALARRSSNAVDALQRNVAAFSTSATSEAVSSSSAGSAWGWATALAAGGAAAAAYGFSAQGSSALLVSQAEAPMQPVETAAGERKPNPYALPTTGLKGLPKEIVVYQYEVCPFCCKLKAFLDYYKLPYRCVEVNPLTKAEVKWSEYKKVPIVTLDGEQLNDSSAIISRLEAELQAAGRSKRGSSSSKGGGGGWFGWGAKRSTAPAAGSAAAAAAAASLEEDEKWRRWVDEWFVRVITVNIYRNAKEAFQTFDYITEHGNFGWAQREAARVVGAGTMWALSGRLKKKYGVEGDVREVLYNSANEWVSAVGDRRFLGGDRPNLADLSVFGVIRAVVGTDTFNELMQHSRIGPWYERMFLAVGDSSRKPDF